VIPLEEPEPENLLDADAPAVGGGNIPGKTKIAKGVRNPDGTMAGS
jgi:hypothetical protein